MNNKTDNKDQRIQELEALIDSLTGKGYMVAGYHFNDDLEPLDNLLEITPSNFLPSIDFDSRYVVVAERDVYDPLKSIGPIVMETMLAGADPLGAIARAEKLTRYGERYICRLELIGTLEQFRTITETQEATQ